MSKQPDLPYATTLDVRDHCLCLSAQRAARSVARHFDEAFRPLALTNGQFSLMMSLNRPEPPTIGVIALFLAMDRTTLTAALKPLERRSLILVQPDKADRRTRLLSLTEAGRALLIDAIPIWRATHDAIDTALAAGTANDLRQGLGRLSEMLG